MKQFTIWANETATEPCGTVRAQLGTIGINHKFFEEEVLLWGLNQEGEQRLSRWRHENHPAALYVSYTASSPRFRLEGWTMDEIGDTEDIPSRNRRLTATSGRVTWDENGKDEGEREKVTISSIEEARMATLAIINRELGGTFRHKATVDTLESNYQTIQGKKRPSVQTRFYEDIFIATAQFIADADAMIEDYIKRNDRAGLCELIRDIQECELIDMQPDATIDELGSHAISQALKSRFGR